VVVVPEVVVPEVQGVNFLGMSLDSAAASAGSWVLLVIGLVLLVATILFAYKYRKSRKISKSEGMSMH
jgi:uncharacterized membrane protein YecN with MAPEG domain